MTPSDQTPAAMAERIVAESVYAWPTVMRSHAIELITAAIKAEREECAKVADREARRGKEAWDRLYHTDLTDELNIMGGAQIGAEAIAAAIRART